MMVGGLTVVLVSLAVVGVRGNDCDKRNEAGACIDNVNDVIKYTKTPVELYTKTTLDQACKLLGDTRTCIGRFGECPAYKAQFKIADWQISERILRYVCGDGKDEYQKSERCFKQDSSVGTEVSTCTRDEQSARPSNDQQKCDTAKTAIECYARSVKTCNEEAKTLMKFFQLHRHKPTVTGLTVNCTLPYDDGDWDDDGGKDGGSKMASLSTLSLLLFLPAILLQL